MVSAKKMCELADSNIQSSHIQDIEEKVTQTAEKGKFYVKLWDGKPVSKDTSLIFVEVYDVEALNHLRRMGYVITTIESPDGTISLYIGWGFDSVSALQIAIKSGND